jgi:hypothetical protein
MSLPTMESVQNRITFSLCVMERLGRDSNHALQLIAPQHESDC